MSSMEPRTDGKRFVKNCTLTSTATGLPESVELFPAVGKNRQQGGGGAPFAQIIHRMWKTVDVPASWSKGATSCRLVNPDHSYCHWTDAELDEFIGVEYSWFLATYRAYTYDIQRVDAARYFVLYHYGGTYLDLDLVCLRPLSDILNAGVSSIAADVTDDIVLVETLPVGVTTEFMAVRRARDPFMRDVVTGLRPNAELWYVFSYPTIMFSTGPMYLSHRLWEMEATAAAARNRSVGAGGDNGRSNGTRVRILERRQFLGEYFEHLVGSSWHRWDGKIIWLFFRLRYFLLVTGIMLVLLIALYVAHRRRFTKPPISASTKV